MNSSTEKIAVIGAGPGGLVTAKELLQKGIEVVVFEKSDYLGGVFGNYGKKDTMWQRANLTSSKWITEFSDYPMPDHYPHFPTLEMMAKYLESYADAFAIRHKIRFREQVFNMSQKQDKWAITTDKGTYEFDRVVIASGLHRIPYIPPLKGKEYFQGRILHSTEVHSAEKFRDRRVLLVGLGESGVFLCSQIAPIAKEMIVSLHRGVNFTPRILKSVPLDCGFSWELGKRLPGYDYYITIGSSLARYIPSFLRDKLAVEKFLPALIPCWNGHGVEGWHRYDDFQNSYTVKIWWTPQEFAVNYNDHIEFLVKEKKCIAVGEIDCLSQNQVHLQDGTCHTVDDIIFATGFTHDLSTELPHAYHDGLYKQIFPPSLPNIAFVGFVRPNAGSLTGMVEMQARYIAQIMANEKSLPSHQEMLKTIAKERAKQQRAFPESSKRLLHLRDFRKFMDDMAKLVGCQIELRKLCALNHGLFAFFFGPHTPHRYRICGDGATQDALQHYIKISKELSSHRIYKSGVLFLSIMLLLLVLVCCIPLFWMFFSAAATYYYCFTLLVLIASFYGLLQFRNYMIRFARVRREQALLDRAKNLST